MPSMARPKDGRELAGGTNARKNAHDIGHAAARNLTSQELLHWPRRQCYVGDEDQETTTELNTRERP